MPLHVLYSLRDFRYGAASLALHAICAMALALGGGVPLESQQAVPGQTFQLVSLQQQNAAAPPVIAPSKQLPPQEQKPKKATKKTAPISPSPTLLQATPESIETASKNNASYEATTPSQAPPQTASRQGVGAPNQDYQRASYLNNSPPAYPMSARKRSIEGKVVLQVELDAAGQPTSVRLSHGSGSEALDNAALEAVRRWRFKPARQNGLSVSSTVIIPIYFRLDGTTVADAN